MSILQPAKLDAAFLAFDTSYQSAYQTAPILYDKMATVLTGSTETIRFPVLAQSPDLREWNDDERQIKNVQTRFEEITAKKWELTQGVPREKFEDDQYGIYAPLMAQMGVSAKSYIDRRIADLLAAGASTACNFDGQNFFDTDHPVDPSDPASAVQSNKFNLALSAANYQTVRAAMMTYKGEGGIPLGVNPNLLVVAANLDKTAREILNSTIIAQPFSNGGNYAAAAGATNVLQGTADLLVNPYLPDDAWYLLDTSRGIRPLVWFNRIAPEFTFLNRPDDQNVFMLDKYIYGVRARGAAGFGPYFLIAKGK